VSTAYIVAGAFEFVGVVWVVGDVYFDRRRAREIAGRRYGSGAPRSPGPRAWIYEAMDDNTIQRDPTSAHARMLVERREGQARADLNRVASRSLLADVEFRDALVDVLRGNIFRRLGGPTCLLIGIVLGTVANIANTH
jgi:hypothetical protein